MSISLTGKVGYISLGRGVTTLSSLTIGILLSRYLTREDYGTYRQLWLIYNTLYPMLSMGLPTSINYFIPRAKESERKTFNLQTFSLLTFGGVILSFIFFFAAPEIAKIFHNPSLIPAGRIFSLVPVLTLPTLYYQNLFISLDKPVLVAKLSIGLGVGRLIAIFLPVIMKSGLYGVLLGLVIFSFVQFAVVTYLMFNPFGFHGISWHIGLLFQQLHYSIPIGLSFMVGTLVKQIDKIIISTFFPPSKYAIYVNGAIEIPLIGVLTGSVTAVLMPEFVRLYAKEDTSNLVSLWHRAIKKVALIMLPIMVFLFLYASEFLTLLFSGKYAESAGIFRIYLLALPTRITTFGTVLLAAGLSILVMRYAIYTLLLNSILSYILVLLIGFPGPAVGTILSIYFIAFLQLQKTSQLLKVNILSIFPWSDLGIILVVSLMSGGVSIWPKFFLPRFGSALRFLTGGATFLTSYLLLVLKFGILNKKDILVGWRIKR